MLGGCFKIHQRSLSACALGSGEARFKLQNFQNLNSANSFGRILAKAAATLQPTAHTLPFQARTPLQDRTFSKRLAAIKTPSKLK